MLGIRQWPVVVAGFVTYSTKDLVHDLLGGYLRLQKARGAARGAAAQKSGKKTQARAEVPDTDAGKNRDKHQFANVTVCI